MNLQKFSWRNDGDYDDDGVALDLRALVGFLLNCPFLQHFDCSLQCGSDSLIQFVFCDAWKERVWKDIRTVEVELWGMNDDAVQNLTQKYEHEQQVMEWWKEFTVSSNPYQGYAVFKASM